MDETAVLDATAREADAAVVEIPTEGRPAPSTEPGAPDAPAEPARGELVVFSPTEHSLMPLREELHGAAELAVVLAGSGLVPSALREKPADVLAVLLTGRELGIAPMTALRTCHVINGTVTVAPKVRMAMVRQQGLGRIWPDEDNDEHVATWYAERHDTPGITYRSTFTWAMAQNITYDEWTGPRGNRSKVERSLVDKDNWKNYPARMLSWRACGYLLDDAFPEVGTGLYAPDDMGALTDEDGEPVLDLQGQPLVSNQPMAPPAPPDPEPNPREHAELVERIGRINAVPEARAALLDLWYGPGGREAPRLPAIDKLRHSQMRTALAAVETVEKRIKAGEFAPAEPAAPERPLDGPQAPSEPESAPEVPDAPTEPATAPVAPEPAQPPYDPANPPADVVEALRVELDALDPEDIDGELEIRHLPTTGNAKAKRTRLGNALLATGWLPTPTGQGA